MTCKHQNKYTYLLSLLHETRGDKQLSCSSHNHTWQECARNEMRLRILNLKNGVHLTCTLSHAGASDLLALTKNMAKAVDVISRGPPGRVHHKLRLPHNTGVPLVRAEIHAARSSTHAAIWRILVVWPCTG